MSSETTFRGKTREEYEEEMEDYRVDHTGWRNQMHEGKKGFFPIFSDNIKPYLKLSGSAIRLFIYLGIHSDKDTGEVKANINNLTMMHFFDCSERSLHNWIAELEKAGLIVRVQTRYMNRGKIFIRPYDVQKAKENLS